MKPSVHVENSVVSDLTARKAQNNVRVAAHQDLTREWWETKRDRLRQLLYTVWTISSHGTVSTSRMR
jgi:hypothetical protein